MISSNLIQQCPVCSHVLSFTSSHTNIIVCRSCGSTINREKDNKLTSKSQFIVTNNPGIIQPGTIGVWQGKSFTVLGRFRAWFEESVFNYWTIRFDDDTCLWLAEGYGIYSILKNSDSATKLFSHDIENDHIGELKNFGSAVRFIVEKKYKTIKWEVEGELYIPENRISSFKVVEYSNAYGKNLTYFEFSKDNVFPFEVSYTSFSALQLKNLRQYDNNGKTFTCTNCSKPVQVKTYPYAQSCACSSCGMQYSLNQGMDFKKNKLSKTNDTIYIPLGSVGKIKGVNYEVIGYVQKEEDNSYHSKWREYTLYNPEEGFAFLSEYDGHWIYIRENCDSPVLLNQNEKSFELDNEPFQLFNSYNYKILNALGEFPYNIFDNQNAKAREFISPPEIWIQERDKKEGITWFQGKHISSADIAAAFQLSNMPYKTGVGAVQPTGYISLSKMFKSTFVGILILLLLHTLIGLSKEERVLLNRQFFFTDSSDLVSLVTEKYVLDKRRSNLRFAIEAPVSNSWFELSTTLVNATTGKEYSMERGVEYYYGYSGGESWSEGDTKENAYLTKIPAGTYFLQLQGTRESRFDKITSFNLVVTYDVVNHRNLWWAIFLLLLWPVGKYFLMNNKEKARWSNSPYSIYE